MLRRELHVPPEHVFPADPWRIVEARYDERYFARTETAFALSNGYLGVRGTFDEGRPAHAHGTFVNGFHEIWPIVHAEEAYGLARTGQTIVNVPDATPIRLYVDEEPLFVPTARLPRYQRVLDMREGTLVREVEWATPSGKHVIVRSCRLVSLEHRHLLAIAYEVVMSDHAAPIVLTSEVVNRQDAAMQAQAAKAAAASDPRLATRIPRRVLEPQMVETEDDQRFLLAYRTASSGMTLGVAVDHLIETDAAHRVSATLDGDRGELQVSADAEPGVPVRIVKLAAYHTSRSAPAAELVARGRWTLEQARREGFEGLVRSQRRSWDRFWDRCDVRVSAPRVDRRMQQAIRWNLFQVGQASCRAEGAGIPAKGLTGGGYDGQYFWDTEVYVLPVLAYTWPRIARNLLRFRHSMLPSARRRARELDQRGAMFPWRTINGEEASAYYQAGTAQYHINADVAYAIHRYLSARGDEDFMVEVGAEILVETARLWEDLGFHDGDGLFHIHSVTGPDEYTTVVNDNTYTNLMARLNLNFAVETVRRLEVERPDDYAALADRVDLRPGEIEAWERAASAMYVPYDEARGIHPQDAHFLEREVWDLEGTPRDHFPLLLHYHPLVIYRRQVIKQADIVLAMFLLGNEFSEEQKRTNFEYYDLLTTGDSSLSACVESIVAAEVGDEERALAYFRFALLMDLADGAGNTSDGVHIASAAGVWQSLVFGFGGVRDYGGELSITPHLPAAWESLDFSLRFRDCQLRVHLAHGEERYLVDGGSPLEVVIRGRRHSLAPGEPLTLEAALH